MKSSEKKGPIPTKRPAIKPVKPLRESKINVGKRPQEKSAAKKG